MLTSFYIKTKPSLQLLSVQQINIIKLLVNCNDKALIFEAMHFRSEQFFQYDCKKLFSSFPNLDIHFITQRGFGIITPNLSVVAVCQKYESNMQ